MFSCEFCEIFKNKFFTKHLWWLLLSVLLQYAITGVYNSTEIEFLTRKHLFSTYAIFSEKLTFLTCAYQGIRNVIFSENFVTHQMNDPQGIWDILAF